MRSHKIVFYSSTDGELLNAVEAKKLIDKRKDINVDIKIFSKYSSKENISNFYDAALEADFILLVLMGGVINLPNFGDFVDKVNEKQIPIYLQSSVCTNQEALDKFTTIDKTIITKIKKYIFNSGIQNYENLFIYLANIFGNCKLPYGEPLEMPLDGIYYLGKTFNNLKEYRDKIGFKHKITIGVLFYRSQYMSGNTKVIDAIIKKGIELGLNILPVFFYATSRTDVGNLGMNRLFCTFFKDGDGTIIDSLINLSGFSISSGNFQREEELDNVLNNLNIHVIKGIMTTQNYKEWKESSQGVNFIDYSLNLVMPEYDGQIIGYPISTKEKNYEEMYIHEPLDEGIDRIVKLAGKFGNLRKLRNQDKRIGIIFHNYPPGDANIGSASGLDSMESISILLKKMKENGYNIEYLPENGTALIEKILQYGTNESKWVDLQKIRERGEFLPKEDYDREFVKLEDKNKLEMKSKWGDSPGEILVDGESFIMPGFLNGNIFIGMQPSRGFMTDSSKIYHSLDLPPHHQYLAYYRYLMNVFKADAIVHVGTHGSLEWLPGKGAALSNSCYPNIVLDTLPNFYYYIVKNPGEGIQAKRRSCAVIVDHMIPPLNYVGDYEDMIVVENLSRMYYDAKLNSMEDLKGYRDKLWEEVERLNLHQDLNFSYDKAFQDFDLFVENLSDYLSEIKMNFIKEGLHVLGQPLQGEELVNMILVLMRVKNGNIPSLQEIICEEHFRYNYDFILANRGKLIKNDSKTYGDLLGEINDLCRSIITSFYEQDFSAENINVILCSHLGKQNKGIEVVLKYISENLVPKLYMVKDEIDYLLKGLQGEFIPPGKSGNISRGGADILPTGRNFYTVDPRVIPSFSAWETGKKLADEMLKDYISTNGEYPKSIALVLWATSTMRSKGDDIAEILYLMGLEPVWDKGSGRVVGLEIIPRKELKRPRIDVTIKISGLFRDTFPSLIELLDKAFDIVSQIEEDENYIYDHVKEDIQKGIDSGLKEETARDNALLRIFGSKPGAYGTGISHAIDSRKWDTEDDLADFYLNWSGYAYGRGKHGEYVKDQFIKRLEKVDITVQNATSRETDILDTDDYYQYHGGLACAVKRISGKKPEMYCGDSSEPDHIKVKSASKELKYVYRSRVLNPNWIESMKKHGYKAAGDLSKMINYTFGWDATTSIMEDWMYEELTKKYIFDEDMKRWFEENNPMALYDIVERLLEAYKRKMWAPKEETLEELLNLYLELEGTLEEHINN